MSERISSPRARARARTSLNVGIDTQGRSFVRQAELSISSPKSIKLGGGSSFLQQVHQLVRHCDPTVGNRSGNLSTLLE